MVRNTNNEPSSDYVKHEDVSGVNDGYRTNTYVKMVSTAILTTDAPLMPSTPNARKNGEIRIRLQAAHAAEEGIPCGRRVR